MNEMQGLKPGIYDATEIEPNSSILEVGEWHRWFAWHPVFIISTGRVWLRTVERRYSVRLWSNRARTIVVTYREVQP